MLNIVLSVFFLIYTTKYNFVQLDIFKSVFKLG